MSSRQIAFIVDLFEKINQMTKKFFFWFLVNTREFI